MRMQIAAALCSAMLGLSLGLIPSADVLAQQKTAKACVGEWRGNKAANQAKGLTLKAFVAQCRLGGTAGEPGGAPAGQRTSTGQKNPGQVYSTIKELMDSIIDPSADVLWNAVGSVVDTQGVHDAAPKTPEEWADVRRAAVRIIEGANLLIIPGREAAPPAAKSEAPGVELEPPQITALIRKNRPSFVVFAKRLQALGVEAAKAADAQNPDMLLEIGSRMEDACESCHQAFWYPPQKKTR